MFPDKILILKVKIKQLLCVPKCLCFKLYASDFEVQRKDEDNFFLEYYFKYSSNFHCCFIFSCERTQKVSCGDSLSSDGSKHSTVS